MWTCCQPWDRLITEPTLPPPVTFEAALAQDELISMERGH